MMEVEAAGVTGIPALAPSRQPNHRVQDVFSAVLAEAGRQGYASAEAVSNETPLSEQISTAWSDWFDGVRGGGRFGRAAEAESLKQTYGEILLRAYEEGGHAAPREFLASLTRDELGVIQRVQGLADPIGVESLTEEGAMNLLLPPPAQVDLNHDGFTRSGKAYGFRFPDSNTPPQVASAWEEVTAGMSPGERMIHEFHMVIPLLTANLVCDSEGRFLYRREPGDPDFVNPMASPDYSYVQASQDRLDYLEAFRTRIPVAQYERDMAFWTSFQERLVENGAK